MIVCSQCGFENQVGHIFCSQCRAKLDLRQLSEQDMLKMKTPPGRKWRRVALALLGLLGVALVLACIPSTLATALGDKVELQQARRKLALLEKGTAAPPQCFTEAEVNACLAADLKSLRQSGAFKLSSLRVQLKPSAVIVWARMTWDPPPAEGIKMGSLAATYGITGVPLFGEQGFRFIVARGRLGHLPLPGPLSCVTEPLIKAHFSGLRQNYPALGAVRRLELEDGKITLFAGP